jgi:hypothetical protein
MDIIGQDIGGARLGVPNSGAVSRGRLSGFASRAALATTLLGAALCSPAAFAGTGSIVVVVSPLQTTASFSGLFDSSVSYKVLVTNPQASGVNQVFVKLTAEATNATGIPAFVEDTLFIPTPGANCSRDVPTVTNVITCPVGDIGPGAAKEFTVAFKVPQAASSETTDGFFNVSGYVPAGQGTNGNDPGSSNGVVFFATEPTLLDKATSDFKDAHAASYVLKTYGSTSVGNGELAAGDAIASSKVKLPKSAPVSIDQEETSKKTGSCSPMYVNCLATTLNIKTTAGVPITFTAPPFELVLTRGPQTLKKTANVANVVLQYQSEEGQPWQDIPKCIGSASPYQLDSLVKRCVISTQPGGPGTQIIHTLVASENGKIGW